MTTERMRIYFCLGIIVAISLCVVFGIAAPFDNWILSKFDFNQDSAMISFWKTVSFLGKPVFIASLTILASLAALLIGNRATFWFLASCGAISFVVEPVMKFLVHRPRPGEIYPDTMPSSWSFPSGHALYSMTLFLSLAYAFEVSTGRTVSISARTAAVAVALLIALSRLELGVHYFTDVVAGALVGYVIVDGMRALQRYSPK